MAEQVVPFQAEITLLQRHQWIKRRTEPRYQCAPATSGKVTDLTGATSRTVWVVNLSHGGAGLLSDSPLEAGTLVVIHLRSSSRERLYQLPARVVHATAHVGGDWMVGCEFAAKIGDDDLEALL
ncbi:MAG TPA: PilZ domain-containing protein [Gemmataceae bacterium]|nr:PilZ domain-containing protein [Gemmataceae bacterium]